MLSTICLCRRASKLIIGFDAVISAIKEDNGFAGIVLASDISAKTEKEVRFYAEKHNREVIKAQFSMEDAQNAVGKRAGVFLISDEGLFKSIVGSNNI
ncbi:MAG: 50S ribosomal protein L7 [Oscillospiraceae bacterium]|nr:50S ribosomal protein L7 [Oscillospiraceae bacterium]